MLCVFKDERIKEKTTTQQIITAVLNLLQSIQHNTGTCNYWWYYKGNTETRNSLCQNKINSYV